MDIVIAQLIQSILEGCETFLNQILLGIVPICLNAEQSMASLTGLNWFDTVYQIFFQLGITMILIKFLKKGFECYVGWSEGDPDSDPVQLVTGFIKAIAVAVCLPALYGFLVQGVTEVTDQVIVAIGDSMAPTLSMVIAGLVGQGLIFSLIALVFFIMLFVLWVQFMGRGLEIAVLRIGMPWACMGLIDSDKGVFGTYLKRLFQSVFSVIVQIALVKLSIGLMVNGHGFWAIACIVMSMKTPKLLQDFLMSYGASPSLGHAAHGISMVIRKLATKGAS